MVNAMFTGLHEVRRGHLTRRKAHVEQEEVSAGSRTSHTQHWCWTQVLNYNSLPPSLKHFEQTIICFDMDLLW